MDLPLSLRYGKDLGLMDRGYPVNGLDLDNDRVFYHQVHPIAQIELHFTIDDGKTNLFRRSKPAFTSSYCRQAT